MQWRWNETSQSGSRLKRKARSRSGGSKINIIIVLALLAGIGWGVAMFSGPFLRKSKFQHDMAEIMRYLVKSDEDTVIEQCIEVAKKDGLPPLKREDFEYKLEIGKDSFIRVKYKETVYLFGGRQVTLDMVAEKELRPPPEP